MSDAALIVLVAVAVLTFVVFVVAALFLVRHVLRLKQTLHDLQERVRPSLDALQAESEAAQRRVDGIEERAERLRDRR